jgi:hypothetical protein
LTLDLLLHRRPGGAGKCFSRARPRQLTTTELRFCQLNPFPLLVRILRRASAASPPFANAARGWGARLLIFPQSSPQPKPGLRVRVWVRRLLMCRRKPWPCFMREEKPHCAARGSVVLLPWRGALARCSSKSRAGSAHVWPPAGARSRGGVLRRTRADLPRDELAVEQRHLYHELLSSRVREERDFTKAHTTQRCDGVA